MRGKILVIAGSDSGGGAGIQADIKTITMLGGYSSTAITALTAQNTREVIDVVCLEPDFVVEQIDSVLTDIGADVIKIGMLGNVKIADAVAECLKRYYRIPVVFDPLIKATSNNKDLMEGDAAEIFKNKLVPIAKLITPNHDEAEMLTGIKINNDDDVIKAGQKILGLGAESVLIKGGHAKNEKIARDILVQKNRIKIFEHQKIISGNTHGTGCTLASAIAISMAQGLNLEKSIIRARKYVQTAIATAPKFGEGNGPLNHFVAA